MKILIWSFTFKLFNLYNLYCLTVTISFARTICGAERKIKSLLYFYLKQGMYMHKFFSSFFFVFATNMVNGNLKLNLQKKSIGQLSSYTCLDKLEIRVKRYNIVII